MNFSKRSFTLIFISLALITGCSAQPTPSGSTPTPAADAPGTPTSTTISASGEVVPAQWTTLSFSQAGTIVDLPVKEGDRVKAGDLIAQLDAVDLKASLLQKQAAVQTAEAQLAQLTAAPRPDEIEAAKQAIAAAKDRVAAAVAQRDQMKSSISQADITEAQTQVYAAQVQLDNLNESMNKVIKRGGFALSAGESLDNYIKITELQRATAQAALDELLRGPTPNQLRVANARITLANAEMDAAQARLNLLQAGPLAQDVAVAQAKVDQAKADEIAVQAQIDQTKLVAPFDGIIANVAVDVNQFVGPGQPIVQLADRAGLRVETTDLDEKDVARLNVGDHAAVTFDALPGTEVNGTITRLAPKAKEGTGVNFTAVIQLDQIPEAVQWGMTANAELTPAEAVVVAQSSGIRDAKISANGKVVPAQKTTLSFSLPGQVIDLRVDVGSAVKAGEVIGQLDTALLDAEIAKAEAAVKVAQAGLDRVKAGPRAEQVAEAQSNLAAGKAVVDQSAASSAVVKDGPTQSEINGARAAAQQAYIDMVAARTKKDVLQSDNDKGKATSKMVDDADKQFAIANRDYQAAQERLNKLQAGANADALRAAQANTGAASADYAAQQAQVNLLLAGARPEDIAVAEANLAQAQAGLERARAMRQQAELVAPFDGIVGDVLIRQGQYVNAGTPIVLLSDPTSLRIETTDLNEKDIASVKVGNKVDVAFDALPGVVVEGTVAEIAPKSNKAAGVNYTVTIDLAQVPEKLRWGMTALVGMGK
jgi:HlyD family secretion protein